MNCRLCPRNCMIDRSRDFGFCGVSEQLKIARVSLHQWEEPCISGDCGSGTIFLSGCSLGCVYCQNHDISDGKVGKVVSIEETAEFCLRLQHHQAHNINFVTPDHYAPQIAQVILLARQKGLIIPVLMNTGGYLSDTILDWLCPITNIWLFDYRYSNSYLAQRYSFASNYPEIAFHALQRIYQQKPQLQFSNDILQEGVVVRILILPGEIQDAKQRLAEVFQLCGNNVIYSIMNQYTPPHEYLQNYPEIDRAVSEEEYNSVIDFALKIGIENAYVQEGGTVDESFIPEFTSDGIEFYH